MAQNTPIYSIAKELKIDSNRIILACKSLGINAKGSTKKLNEEELNKIKTYFASGKNVSEEIIDLNSSNVKAKTKPRKINQREKIKYFTNRLIGKS